MPIELPNLPYPMNALEPQVSAATLDVHYGKHHRAYVDKTNLLVAGTELAGRTLEDVIAMTASRKRKATLFNSAAQAWNHGFLWNSMTPGGGGEARGALGDRIKADFKGWTEFREAFKASAVNHFASGWTWLILDAGRLRVVSTANADTPIVHGKLPLLTLDLWEHAYYLDYKNRRPDYVEGFLDRLANWNFAERNYQQAIQRKAAE